MPEPSAAEMGIWPSRRRSPNLVDARAATVDEVHKHDDEEDSGYDSNDGYVIHVGSLLVCLVVEVFLEGLGHDDDGRAQGDEKE